MTPALPLSAAIMGSPSSGRLTESSLASWILRSAIHSSARQPVTGNLFIGFLRENSCSLVSLRGWLKLALASLLPHHPPLYYGLPQPSPSSSIPASSASRKTPAS